MKFKIIKGNFGIIKPESLSVPLVGVLIERKPGKFSPIYVIQDLQGRIHRVLGCTDLDRKLSGVGEGETISIQFEKYAITSKGYQMVIMLVQVEIPEVEGCDEKGLKESEHFVDYSNALMEVPEIESKVANSVQPNILERFGVSRKK
jgi:hypothetical protein